MNPLKAEKPTVLTSPEIAVTKDFNQDILQGKAFKERLVLFAVDELHLVHQWKSFRPQYAEIGVIRNRLPRDVPMLGVSATLEPGVLKIVQSSAGFKPGTDVQKSSIDRQKMVIIMEESRAKRGSGITWSRFDDLRRVFPSNVTHRSRIPKTLIFVNSITKIHKLYDSIRTEWLPELNYPKEAGNWVKTYYSDMPDFEKQRIADEFEKPDNIGKEDIWSLYRVLITTDAYGMGVDSPDIVDIWQFDFPGSLPIAWQRLGRGKRSYNRCFRSVEIHCSK